MELADIVRTCIDWASYGVGGALLNQGIHVVFPAVSSTLYPKKIKMKVGDDKLEPHQNLPLSYGALDYLNLASSIVHNDSEGDGDCKDYSNVTYNVYMKLIQLNNRGDLEKKVRLVGGDDGDIGHDLIEFEDSGKIMPYETTIRTPPLSPEQVENYSTRTRTEKILPIKSVWCRSLRGRKVFYPTLEAVFFPGGFIRVLCKLILYKFNKYKSEREKSKGENAQPQQSENTKEMSPYQFKLYDAFPREHFTKDYTRRGIFEHDE